MARPWMLVTVVLVVVLMPTVSGKREPRVDPLTHRVKLLFIGDTGMRTWRELAFDPLLQVSPIPATTGHFPIDFIRRTMRLYLPRNYVDYIDRVDLIVLSDTDNYLFTNDQELWFRDGVIEDGIGLIMAGGFEAFGGFAWGTTWAGSSVEDALPVKSLTHQAWESNFYGRPTEVEANHPFITGLPWEAMPPFGGMNKVVPDQGSTILLESRSASINMPDGEPVLIYGEVGSGAGLAHAPDWNPGWGSAVMNDWEYYGDYVVNMAYLVVGVSIPQDIQLSHLVRRELAGYSLQKSVALSLIEFADMFGGNVMSLEKRIPRLEKIKEEAEELYIIQDYDGVLEKMAVVTEQLMELHEDAVRVKDQALFWIYLIEWLSVTATSLLCGFLLWTLMVRRRMYSEVGTTRLVSINEP